jgi:hypothetical protein
MIRSVRSVGLCTFLRIRHEERKEGEKYIEFRIPTDLTDRAVAVMGLSRPPISPEVGSFHVNDWSFWDYSAGTKMV